MNSVAIEGDLVTIKCTVESFPLAQLTLTKMLATNSSPEYIQLPSQQHVNQLSYSVNATAAHAGFYNCTATNAEGSQTKKNKLLVKCKWFSHVERKQDLSLFILFILQSVCIFTGDCHTWVLNRAAYLARHLLTVPMKWPKVNHWQFFHICGKIQMHPKMWRSNLNPASASRKTHPWLCNAMLSPIQKWCHLPGWSGLTERLKSSRTPRPSPWSQSVLPTVENTAAEPQMQLELETLSKLWFM